MTNPKLFALISNIICTDFENFNRKIFDAVLTDSTTDNGIRLAVFTEAIINVSSSLTDITTDVAPIHDSINSHHSNITYTSVIVIREFFFCNGHPAPRFSAGVLRARPVKSSPCPCPTSPKNARRSPSSARLIIAHCPASANRVEKRIRQPPPTTRPNHKGSPAHPP